MKPDIERVPLRALLSACIFKETIYKLDKGSNKHPDYHEPTDSIPLIVALQGKILLRVSL